MRRQTGVFNWLLEPALLTAAPIACWLLLNHRLVSGPKVAAHRIGAQMLLVLVGAAVLVLFPLIPPIGHF